MTAYLINCRCCLVFISLVVGFMDKCCQDFACFHNNPRPLKTKIGIATIGSIPQTKKPISIAIKPQMIEPTSEAYFFDMIKQNQREKFYPIYNTTTNTSSVAARILGALLLLILPFKFIFVLFAVAMFFTAFLSTKAREFVERKK